jgi:hypothetical protein
VIDKTENIIKSNVIKKRIKRGGKRPNSGRKPGVQNKFTFELKRVAAIHGEDAIKVMVSIMNDPEIMPNVRLMAADKLLDRGYGKPAIAVDVTETNLNVFPPKEVLDAIYQEAMAQAAERDKILIGRRERLGIVIEHGEL